MKFDIAIALLLVAGYFGLTLYKRFKPEAPPLPPYRGVEVGIVPIPKGPCQLARLVQAGGYEPDTMCQLTGPPSNGDVEAEIHREALQLGTVAAKVTKTAAPLLVRWRWKEKDRDPYYYSIVGTAPSSVYELWVFRRLPVSGLKVEDLNAEVVKLLEARRTAASLARWSPW
jgi:hypothetical protein